MRIAIATVEYAAAGMVDGGLANYLSRAVRQLVQRGHECEVILCQPLYLPADEDRVWEQDGVVVRLLSAQKEMPAALTNAKAPTSLKELLAAAWWIGRCVAERHAVNPFDVVHTTNYGLPSLFLDSNIPVVLRLSSYQPLIREGFAWQMNATHFAIEMLERRVIGCADGCYAPSNLLAGRVGASVGVAVHHVWPPACLEISPDKWDEAWLAEATKPGCPYLLFVGSLNRLKGCRVLAEALPALWAACPDLHVRLAGRDHGGWAWLEPLQDLYPGRLFCHGLLDHTRLYPLMRDAVGVVTPYLVDNLANVIIEAMLLGTCVIGTRGTSAEELLDHSGGGLLVPPGDPVALADSMIKLAKTAESRRVAMGQEGRTWIMTELNPDSAISRLEWLMDKVHQDPAGCRPPAEAMLQSVCADLGSLFAMEEVWADRLSESVAARRRIRARALYWEARYSRLASAFPVRQMRAIARLAKALTVD